MKKQWIWILGAAALLGMLVGAWFWYDALKDGYQPEGLATQPTEQTGQTQALAPDITVYQADGKPVKLSDMRGKPVVLNVWASWCGPCKQEMPDFQAAYETYGDRLHFMMVNLTGQDSLADAQALLQDAGYTFPVYFDTDNEAAMTYNTGSIPASFFIDGDGRLVTYAVGAINRTLLEQGISMLQE